MALPTKIPRWMNDTTGIDPAKVTEPTSGKADVGFLDEEKPGAEFLNYLFYWFYKWCLYVNGLVAGTETAALLWGTQVRTSAADIRHGVRTTIVPAAFMAAGSGAGGWTLQGAVVGGATPIAWAAGGTSRQLHMPILLPVGEHLETIRAFVFGDAVELLGMKLYKQVGSTGVITQVGATVSTVATATLQTITMSLIDETMVSGTSYWVTFVSGATSVTQAVYHAEHDSQRIA